MQISADKSWRMSETHLRSLPRSWQMFHLLPSSWNKYSRIVWNWKYLRSRRRARERAMRRIEHFLPNSMLKLTCSSAQSKRQSSGICAIGMEFRRIVLDEQPVRSEQNFPWEIPTRTHVKQFFVRMLAVAVVWFICSFFVYVCLHSCQLELSSQATCISFA